MQKLLTLNGKTLNLTQWVEETGLPFSTIQTRSNKLGWSPEKILTEPRKERSDPYTIPLPSGEISLTMKEWTELLGVSRQAIHKTAKKRGLTTAEEVCRRVEEDKEEVEERLRRLIDS